MRLCENPDCQKPFEPCVHNQRICDRSACKEWKSRANRKAYRARLNQSRGSPLWEIECLTWADGCSVNAILFCPFPGVTHR